MTTKTPRGSLLLTILLMLAIPGVTLQSKTTAQSRGELEVRGRSYATRSTVAIGYRDKQSTSVELIGSPLSPLVIGKAEVKRSEGRTRIKLKITNLQNPQALGSFFTTYVVWAVAPEGQADNLGELVSATEHEVDLTTPYQTFALIITAEPHGLVRLPGPSIVEENALRRETRGQLTSSRIEYRGYSGALYVRDRQPIAPVEYGTPLVVLGARYAVEIARRAGAERFAEPELREAEI